MRKPLLVIAGLLGLWTLWAFFLPASPPAGTVFSVPMGAGAGTVGRALADAGAVRSAFAFKLVARFSGRSDELKAGDYEVSGSRSVLGVLDLLVSGKSLLQKLLVREGLSAAQIGALLEQQQLGSAKAFLDLARDPGQAQRLKVPGPTLEGYLFPDSYFVAKGMSEQALIDMMVARFHQKVPASLLAQGAAIRLDPRRVMTMASLIEKEARADKERSLVSGVFRSRMRQKKRLESCATVRYALDKYTGPLYNKDLLVKSPYNTYQNFDLPPGPIASPGLASIHAALHPAETDALYFVVAGDGTHVFSKTFEEHEQAKQRYKRLKKGVVED